MSVSSGHIEEEILTLERQVWQLPDRHALGVRLVALEQQLAQLWSGAGFPPAVTGPPPTNTTFSGFVFGCNALPLAGATVVVNPTGTTTSTWTGTTDATGKYSGAIYRPGTISYTVTITPAAARFQSTSFAQSFNSANFVLPGKTLAVASGYACENVCVYPLRTTIQVLDVHLNQNFTMTYFPSVQRWLGNHNGSSFALELSGQFGTGSGGACIACCDLVSRTCYTPTTPTNWVYQFNNGTGGFSWPDGSQFIITDP